MAKPKILVAIDFDNTLVDCNVDVKIKMLAGSNEIPNHIEMMSKESNGWIPYMSENF